MLVEFMFYGEFKLHYLFSIMTFKKAQYIECDVTQASNEGKVISASYSKRWTIEDLFFPYYSRAVPKMVRYVTVLVAS